MTTAARAVQETADFLDVHVNLDDSREVRVVAPFGAGEREITIGTIRTLYALAMAAGAMREKITEADAAYTAFTGER